MTREKILAMTDSCFLVICSTRGFSLFIQYQTFCRPDWFWYTASSPFIFFLNVWSPGPLHIIVLSTNYWFLSNFLISCSRQFFICQLFFFSPFCFCPHMGRKMLRKDNRKGNVNIHVVVVLGLIPKQSITKSSSNVLSADWGWMF